MKRLEFLVLSLPNSAFSICEWPGCLDFSKGPGEPFETPAAFDLRTLGRSHIMSVCPGHMLEACEFAVNVVRRLTRHPSAQAPREEPQSLKVDLVRTRLNRRNYVVEFLPELYLAAVARHCAHEKKFFTRLNLEIGCEFVYDGKTRRWIWRFPGHYVPQRSQSVWAISGGLPTLGKHHR